jgi:hypothetical protein
VDGREGHRGNSAAAAAPKDGWPGIGGGIVAGSGQEGNSGPLPGQTAWLEVSAAAGGAAWAATGAGQETAPAGAAAGATSGQRGACGPATGAAAGQ